jgi:hypothetical protein
LQQDMYEYLDAVETFTDQANTSDDEILVVAREHLPRLISAVRGTLMRHTSDAFGHCLGCPPEWSNGSYTRAVWPCRVVNDIYGFMVKPETIYLSVNVDSADSR